MSESRLTSASQRRVKESGPRRRNERTRRTKMPGETDAAESFACGQIEYISRWRNLEEGKSEETDGAAWTFGGTRRRRGLAATMAVRRHVRATIAPVNRRARHLRPHRQREADNCDGAEQPQSAQRAIYHGDESSPAASRFKKQLRLHEVDRLRTDQSVPFGPERMCARGEPGGNDQACLPLVCGDSEERAGPMAARAHRFAGTGDGAFSHRAPEYAARD